MNNYCKRHASAKGLSGKHAILQAFLTQEGLNLASPFTYWLSKSFFCEIVAKFPTLESCQ